MITCKEKKDAEIQADFGRCFSNEPKGKVCEGVKWIQLTQNEGVRA
jgi:hypothetical protein